MGLFIGGWCGKVIWFIFGGSVNFGGGLLGGSIGCLVLGLGGGKLNGGFLLKLFRWLDKMC